MSFDDCADTGGPVAPRHSLGHEARPTGVTSGDPPAVGARAVRACDKSFPATLEGRSINGLSAPLAEFSTPLLVLDEVALEQNIQVLADWVALRGLELMPHGKTTMAPALWRRQLAAGAVGITVATPWQARVALSEGVPTVQIANGCVDPNALRWLASWRERHPDQDVVCWVDSLAAVSLMERALEGVGTIGVLVELGAAGGRTGVREPAVAARIAGRVAGSPVLSLRGVAGYEGALAHDRSAAALAAVRGYCDRLGELFEDLRELVDGPGWISAGGSAYFDIVADSFAAVPNARRILRPGAYLVHDSGFYRGVSPLDGQRTPGAEDCLLPAMWAFSRVVSQPEAGLALLDAGRRDLSFDEGLPEPVAVARQLGGPERPLDARITALNDQHAFLRWTGEVAPVMVGDVVRLGLSHPCTALDKWRLIPVVGADRSVVVGAVETFF